MFDQVPAPPDVHDRDDRPVGAVLDRDRARVASLAIDEVLERHDPFVAKPVGPIDADHSREVALLRPELGRVCELPEQVWNNLVSVERPPLGSKPEMLLGDVLREDARVVAVPVDRSRAARRTVLA